MKINVFSSGRNSFSNISTLIQSLNESLSDFSTATLYYFADGSTDASKQAYEASLCHFTGNLELLWNEDRLHKSRNFISFRNAIGENSLNLIVDADDNLLCAGICGVINAYQEGFLLGWTNFKNSTGRKCQNLPIPVSLPPRRVPWLSSHLFWFSGCRANYVTDKDLMIDGRYLSSACDVAIALPILESTMRRHYSPEVAYLYTDNLTSNHHASQHARSKQKSNKTMLYQREATIPEVDQDFLAKHWNYFCEMDLLFYFHSLERVRSNGD